MPSWVINAKHANSMPYYRFERDCLTLGAEASAAIYSIVVTAKLNGLNQRACLEWLIAEMPNDSRLSKPGRVDRYLPWSGDVPASCRLATGRADEAEILPDEPIVGAEVLESLPETS